MVKKTQGGLRRDPFHLKGTLEGLSVGFVFGLALGIAIEFVLGLFGAKLEYSFFLKGKTILTIGRIFLGNSLIALLLHFLPELFPKRKNLPAILVGTVGFVLGFFAETSEMSLAEYFPRIPHTVFEVFAYVASARGGKLWPAFVALAMGAVFEWALVLG